MINNMENDNINKGKKLFIVIVVVTIFLQLAPSFPATGSSIEVTITRLIFPISVIVLYLFLAYGTYKGYKWARITLAVPYLASLIFSLPTVLFLLSYTRSTNFVMLAYEIPSVLFAIFSAIALLKSKNLIAFLESNRGNHQHENTHTPEEVHVGESVAKQGIFARLKKAQIYQVVLGIGVFILFTQYIWKSLYVGGVVPGVYWLFFYLDEWFLESVKYTFILAGLFFIVWILGKLFVPKIAPQSIKIFGSLIFVGFAIVFTFPVVMAHSTVFIEKLQVRNTIYYLSAYPMFAEVNYSVAQCEFTGQFCKTIFVSGDITGTNWLNSHLKYNDTTKELTLVEDEEGIIFTKVLK